LQHIYCDLKVQSLGITAISRLDNILDVIRNATIQIKRVRKVSQFVQNIDVDRVLDTNYGQKDAIFLQLFGVLVYGFGVVGIQFSGNDNDGLWQIIQIKEVVFCQKTEQTEIIMSLFLAFINNLQFVVRGYSTLFFGRDVLLKIIGIPDTLTSHAVFVKSANKQTLKMIEILEEPSGQEILSELESSGGHVVA
jgi:hypothetical protein